MDRKTKKKLEKGGWSVGDVQEFLNLSEEEMKLIDLRIRLGKFLKKQREKCGYTQTQLAKEINSSQSRIAKMENGSSNITIDSLLISLFYLKTPTKEICNTFIRI